MNALQAQRRQLAAELNAGGVRADAGIPQRFTPPLAVVTAGAPWIEPGQRFGHHRVRWVVTLTVPPADRTVQQDQLDQLVTDAAVALEQGDLFDVETAGQPYQLVMGTATYVAVDLTVTSTDTDLTETETEKEGTPDGE